MNDKSRSTSTWFFLLFLVVIIIGGLLFIRNQTQFNEAIAVESSNNNHELEDVKLELSEKREELSNVKDELLITQMKLTTETEQLNTQLDDRNREIQTLQGQLDQQNTQIDNKNKDIQTLQGQLDQKNTQLDDRNRDIETLQGQLDQQNTQIDDKNRDIQTLQGQLDQKNTQLDDKNKDIETLQGQLDQQNTQIDDKNRDIQTLQGQLDQKNTQLDDKNKDIQTLQGQLDQKNTQLDDKNKDIQTLQGQLDQQNTQIDDKNRDIRTLQGQLDQKNTQLDDKNKDIQTLQGQLDQKNTQLDDKNKDIQTLQGQLDQQNTQIDDKNRDIQTLQGQLDQKNTQLDDKNKDIQTLQGQLDQKNTQLDDKNKDIQTLQGQLDQQNTQIDDKNRDIQTLQGQLDQKNTQLDDKNKDIETLQGQLDQQNTQIDDKNRDIQTLQGQLDQKNTQLDDKNKDIQTLQGQLDQQNTQIDDKNRDIQTLQGQLDQKNTQLDDKNKDIQTLQGQLDQKNTQLDDKNKDIQTLQGQLDQQNTQIDDKNRDIQTLQGQLDQKNTQLDDKNRELLTIKKTLSNSQIRSMIEKIDISQRDQNLSNIKRRLKDFYIKDYNLTHIDKDILSNYNYGSTNDEVHWRLNEANIQSKCIKLSEFGIKLLRHVNNIPKDSRKYSRVINDIVKRIKNLIDNNIETLGENENVIEASATLLSMHMLIYPVKSGSMVSHYTITKSIPEIPSIKSNNYSNSYGHFDENKYKKLLKLSTPRLLTNYINNTNAYLHDVNSGALYVFNSIINNDYCDHVMLDGIRQDGSAFTFHPTRNVLHIDYSYYLKDVISHIKYPDFYASVYSELKIPGNYYDIVKKIVSILMHPKLDVVLHGLISSEGKTKLNFNWLDIKGETGCYIIPSIGFGNFKTDKFMFSLRIQMFGIPTSCLKNCETEQRLKCNPFATSIMNIRNIHIVENSRHKDYENWDAVNTEAGIITGLENNMYMLLDESIYVYSDGNNNYSNSNYIGQLTLENQVMFWKRDCHINSAEDINYKITEVGVFTSYGLEAIYNIYNLGSSPLRFKWVSTSETVNHQCVDMINCSDDNHRLILPTGQPISFKWYMCSGKKYPVNLTYEEKKQTFNYNGHKYIVENMPDDPQSFTVKCDTEDNVILIGNNSIRVNDAVTYNNVTYYRDNRTMMYMRP